MDIMMRKVEYLQHMHVTVIVYFGVLVTMIDSAPGMVGVIFSMDKKANKQQT